MGSIENIQQPDIKAKELLTLLETIQWESGYIFAFNGTEFCIDVTDSNDLMEAEKEGTLREKHGEPAEIFGSTYVNGWDIYLHDTIPKKDRKRILFHEILEGNIRSQGFSMKQAHETALREEEKIFGERRN